MNGNQAEATPTRLDLYDPPMCCPGGLCGPAVDPELLKIHEALLAVKKEFGDRTVVNRYVLSQTPAKFMANPDLVTILKSEGVNALPITMVNGRIIKKGGYTSLDELRQAILSG
ncbi:MAG: arsenite efflux transporter metallochaperone ArsD [Bacillota bacterium]